MNGHQSKREFSKFFLGGHGNGETHMHQLWNKSVQSVDRQATTPLHFAGRYLVNVASAPTRQRTTDGMSCAITATRYPTSWLTRNWDDVQ